MAEVAVKKYEGYRGWGPLMDDPDSLRERVCTEQMNNALVAALFLTMTIPWFCEPMLHKLSGVMRCAATVDSCSMKL